MEDIEDMQKLQLDLHAVYKWAKLNNMEFNSDKFEHIRYQTAKSPSIDNTGYLSNIETQICTKNNLRDLGVTISDDATFNLFIEEVDE